MIETISQGSAHTGQQWPFGPPLDHHLGYFGHHSLYSALGHHLGYFGHHSSYSAAVTLDLYYISVMVLIIQRDTPTLNEHKSGAWQIISAATQEILDKYKPTAKYNDVAKNGIYDCWLDMQNKD